jgi:uncharacterized membrane protein (UPF0127 family)
MVNASTGQTLATRAAVAETIFTRFLGLQGKRRLPAGSGLILLPSNGIHMFFMNLRIDAVFVAEGGRVLRVARGLRPWTIGPIVPGALYCAELPEGAAADTQLGHVIELRAANTTPHTA